jgi:hypothetical protein
MTFISCPREREISDLLKAGHWPHACAPELRAHVQSCVQCRDVITVTHAFAQAQADPVRATPLEAAGVLWWRAQLRRRRAALEYIARPITAAQIFALSINVLVAIAFLFSQARHGLHWLTSVSAPSQTQAFHLETLWTGAFIHSGGSSWSVMLALGTLAFCAAIALYLATERQ